MGPLFLLAFDHRAVFARTVFGTDGEPTPAQEEQMRAAKRVILEGGLAAVAQGAPAGVLVDELYGADVARAASAAGMPVVMPVELPDQDVFAFAYGDDWRAHVEAFEPDFAKVLVRWDPDGSAADNELQAARLAELSRWLRATGRRFLFELILPPERDRATTMLRAIEALQDADVEPDVWKLEGLDREDDARAVVAQARTGGRDHVICTILGAGAPDDRVDHWLGVAARVDGFAGFAIGRSIWRDPIKAWLAGTLDRDAAAARIAESYLRFVAVYESA